MLRNFYKNNIYEFEKMKKKGIVPQSMFNKIFNMMHITYSNE